MRVMVVDDSSTVRGFVKRWVSSSPDLEFVGEAEDGQIALRKLKEISPQVIVLDVEMPNMSGIETLKGIKAIDPTIQVVMFSTLTEAGALVTFDALALGASDYLTKPTSISSAESGTMADTRHELIEKVTALGRRRHSRIAATMVPQNFSSRQAFESSRAAAVLRGGLVHPDQKVDGIPADTDRPTVVPNEFKGSMPASPPVVDRATRRAISPPKPFRAPTSGKLDRFRAAPVNVGPVAMNRAESVRRPSTSKAQLLVLGVSTGGPVALMEFLPSLPKDFPIPILVVQHMPAVFTRLLADRLNQRSQMAVTEAKEGDRLLPGTAYIAPGERHLVVKRDGSQLCAALIDSPPVNSCRPSVDVMFNSAVAAVAGAILAVVMTGMGSDGAKGAAAICSAGGEVIVQDEATSVVWGMPGAVVAAGIQSGIYPLGSLSSEVMSRVVGDKSRRGPLVGAGGGL